jgi:hypothetical protein
MRRRDRWAQLMSEAGATAVEQQTQADPAGPSSTGELLSRLSEQSSRLVREELALAKTEVSQKAKRLGMGAGMLAGAGLMAFFGLGVLITTAILALALIFDAWLAALVVMVALFIIAAALALIGKRQIARGVPPSPGLTIESVKADIDTVKESAHHGTS